MDNNEIMEEAATGGLEEVGRGQVQSSLWNKLDAADLSGVRKRSAGSTNGDRSSRCPKPPHMMRSVPEAGSLGFSAPQESAKVREKFFCKKKNLGLEVGKAEGQFCFHDFHA